MTKIALISDTHNEFLREVGISVPDIKLTDNADVLVLAGDIDTQVHGANYAVRQSNRLGIPVIYVLGNHEYYGSDSEPVLEKILNVTTGTNVHVLDSDSVIIDDTLFIGATLWTDFELLGNEKRKLAISHAAFNLNDYAYNNIRLVDRPFSPNLTPSTTLSWHEVEKEFIESELSNDFDGKKVVVTHHAPSLQCLPQYKRHDLISACYASNLDWMINKYQPDAWLYGHIHYPQQTKAGKTVVANNARGYPNIAGVTEFYEPLVIEI